MWLNHLTWTSPGKDPPGRKDPGINGPSMASRSLSSRATTLQRPPMKTHIPSQPPRPEPDVRSDNMFLLSCGILQLPALTEGQQQHQQQQRQQQHQHQHQQQQPVCPLIPPAIATGTNTLTHTHTHTHTHIHERTNAHLQFYSTHTCTHRCTHKYTNTHTHIHTHAHQWQQRPWARSLALLQLSPNSSSWTLCSTSQYVEAKLRRVTVVLTKRGKRRRMRKAGVSSPCYAATAGSLGHVELHAPWVLH